MNDDRSSVRGRLESTVNHLCGAIGPRPPGSEAERRSAGWIAEQLAGLGYEPVLEEFDCPAHGAEAACLTGLGEDLPIWPTQHSPTGRVTGRLQWLGFGEEHLRGDLAGKIGVLLADGSLTQRNRLMERLESAGLAGAIVAGPYADSVTGKAVRPGNAERMLAATVSVRTARRLAGHFGRQATLEITGDRPTPAGTSQNVVAALPGDGPNTLVVCAHYDTAACSGGALDNASGTALLLELARQLAGRQLQATVLLVATGAEEFGADDACGLGAKDLFARRIDGLGHLIGCFAVDAVGDRLGVRHLRVAGPAPFRSAVPTFPNVARTDRRMTSCDAGSAYHFGLASVSMIDEYVHSPYFHGPEDTPELLDFDAMVEMLGVCGEIVAALASQPPPQRHVRSGELLVRPARWDDIGAMCEITREAFGPYSLYRMREEFFGEPLGGQTWDHHKAQAIRDGARRALDWHVVAEIGGQVVGYASYLLDGDRQIAHVGNNAVRCAFQRRGIAKAMQREVMARFAEEGFGRWSVATLENDVPAQKLYAGMGFREITRMITYLRK